MKYGIPSESAEQIAVFEWAKYAVHRYPELALLHASANGGLRSKITAARMKKEGVKAGLPDIHLPVARGGYHGLWIELKRQDGRPTEAQIAWINSLLEYGNQALICYGADDCINRIIRYLESK